MSEARSPAGPILYRGKAKTIYGTDRPDQVLIFFRDDITAGNGRKRAEIPGKGMLNSRISALLFAELERAGVATHFLEEREPGVLLARAVRIVPLEVVVRNRAAGSLSQRLGLPEGEPLPRPVVEHYYKRDDLGDPLVNRDHIRALGIASDDVIDRMEAVARRVNEILIARFARAGLLLVDFKLEFGLVGDELLVADELSPDTMRVWDAKSGHRLDKDRFRRDWGGVREGYEEIWRRLQESQVENCTAPGSPAAAVRAAATLATCAPAATPAAGAPDATPAGTAGSKSSGTGTFSVWVRIMPKEGMLDPQGRAVRDGLRALGFPGVADVRVGKMVRLRLAAASEAAARKDARAMAHRLLANPIIEEFAIDGVVPGEGSR
ncbi:MAG TPA: phosphoribosylaminoimidazolesuccinocarboxamide synthase [Limnochordales bacterium]